MKGEYPRNINSSMKHGTLLLKQQDEYLMGNFESILLEN